ncbi:MAG: hypothetical protein ABFS03_12185, partial [Chloroflexota bacterium]
MGTDVEAQFLSKPVQDKWPYLVMGFFFLNFIVKSLPIFRGIMIHPDAPVYLWSAQALGAGNVQGAIAAYPMLFYPFLIMLVHKLGVDWLWAGRLISVTASCFALLPFMAIARKFSKGWPLVFVTLLFILLPSYNFRAYAVLRDPLYISLTLCCLYYALQFLEDKSLKTFFVVMCFSFFLPLLRIEGVVTALLVDSWCLVLLLWSPEKNKKFIALLLLVVTAALLCFLFYSDTFSSLVRLQSVTYLFDKLSSGQLSVQSCLKALDDLQHSLPASTFGNNFWQVIQRHWPWIYFIGMLYVIVKILGWPVLVLSSVGLVTVFRQIEFRKMFLVSVFAGQILCMMLFYLFSGFLEVRFMLLPAILLLFFFLFSLEAVFDFLYEKVGRFFSFKRKHFLIVFSCFLVLPFAYDSLFHKYRTHIPLLEEACLWIKSEILKEGGGEWFVGGNARRMAWFLDREDMQQPVGKIGYDDIEKRFSK